MALAHHQAAFDHQRRRGKAEFIRTEHGPDHHISPGLDLTVNLQHHSLAQLVDDKRLLRFRQPNFPATACVLNGGNGAGSRTAVVSGNDYMVGLGYTRGDRAHARFADEFHRNIRFPVGTLEVIDKLSQILNRIDVVVRRRRDQPHAGHRIAQFSDVLSHFVPR